MARGTHPSQALLMMRFVAGKGNGSIQTCSLGASLTLFDIEMGVGKIGQLYCWKER